MDQELILIELQPFELSHFRQGFALFFFILKPCKLVMDILKMRM